MASPMSRRKRANPFLRRSWVTSVGSPSADPRARAGRPAKKSRRADADADDDDDGADENYKASHPQPATSETSMRLRQAERSSGPDSQRAIRQARARPMDSKAEPQSLRISMREIVHGTLRHGRIAPASATTRDGDRTRALCTVAISCSFDSLQPAVRHRESQLCTFETLQSPNSQHRMANITLTRPFLIVRESLLVNRGESLEFADSYDLTIEFEAGEGPWPPFRPTDFGIGPGQSGPFASASRKWVLKARVADIFKRPRNFIKMSLLTHNPDHHRGTDHYLMVDIAWASPASPAVDVTPATPSFPVLDAPRSNGVSDPLQTETDVDMAPERDSAAPEDVSTPNRPRRGREAAKQAAIQQANDRAANGNQGSQVTNTAASATSSEPVVVVPSTSITYQFPSLSVALDAFSCAVCGSSHPSITHLQAHLQVNHEQFEFEMKDVAGKGLTCLIRHRTDDDPTISRPLSSLVDVNKTFGLQRIMGGDEPTVAEAKAVEAKAVEVKAVEVKAAEVKAAEVKAAEVKAAEVKAAKGTPLVAEVEAFNGKQTSQSPQPSSPIGPIYRPLLTNAADIPNLRAHISWLNQADASDLEHESELTRSELTRRWDEWLNQRRLNEPVSLQYELTRFVRAMFDMFSGSEPLRNMLVSRLRLLVDNKAIDEAYSSSLLELIGKAEKMSQKNGVANKKDGDAPEKMDADTPGSKGTPDTSLAPETKSSAAPWKPSPPVAIPTGDEPKVSRNYVVISDSEGDDDTPVGPPTIQNGSGLPPKGEPQATDPHTSKDEDKNPPPPAKGGKKPPKAIESPIRTMPKRSGRAARVSYIYDPFEMLDDDSILEEEVTALPAASAQKKRNRATMDDEPPALKTPIKRKVTAEAVDSFLYLMAAPPLPPITPGDGGGGDPPAKRKRGRPRKNPVPDSTDVTPMKETPVAPVGAGQSPGTNGSALGGAGPSQENGSPSANGV